LKEIFVDLREFKEVFLTLEAERVDDIDDLSEGMSTLDTVIEKVENLPDLVADRVIVSVSTAERLEIRKEIFVYKILEIVPRKKPLVTLCPSRPAMRLIEDRLIPSTIELS